MRHLSSMLLIRRNLTATAPTGLLQGRLTGGNGNSISHQNWHCQCHNQVKDRVAPAANGVCQKEPATGQEASPHLQKDCGLLALFPNGHGIRQHTDHDANLVGSWLDSFDGQVSVDALGIVEAVEGKELPRAAGGVGHECTGNVNHGLVQASAQMSRSFDWIAQSVSILVMIHKGKGRVQYNGGSNHEDWDRRYARHGVEDGGSKAGGSRWILLQVE